MLSLPKYPLRSRIPLVVAHQPHVRTLRQAPPDPDDGQNNSNDFILSILHASPSARDTKSYRNSFGLKMPETKSRTNLQQPKPRTTNVRDKTRVDDLLPKATFNSTTPDSPHLETIQKKVQSILDPIQRHTGLVKIQGPFNDIQLESIARGMVYLEKLGLVSVIVVERDDWKRGMGDENERTDVVDEAARVVRALEQQGARARPIFQAIARLGPKPSDPPSSVTTSSISTSSSKTPYPFNTPEAHTLPTDLQPIQSALRAGEIPVLTPFALDSYCRTTRIDANDLIAALARGMVEVADLEKASTSSTSSVEEFDLTPLRLMIINREGGIPSYARDGLPHLVININGESSHIKDTFLPTWRESHPTALSNLRLAESCLAYMPSTSSAVIVSHRSPRSLIANLITNKPAHSSSLPHALLQGTAVGGAKKVTPHTPTIIRAGLPIRVLRNLEEVDQTKLTALLEASFGRKLDADHFYERLEDRLDYVIVAGDYSGAAIVTNEDEAGVGLSPSSNPSKEPISYLDKFAVHPSHQGDGTVDFLWVALHDESYGLGLASALNPNPGGMHGRGRGRDLVWRSRDNNPVNKWYFERSSGHFRIPTKTPSPTSSASTPSTPTPMPSSMIKKKPGWAMFWCDAEARLTVKERVLKERAEELSLASLMATSSLLRTPAVSEAREGGGKVRWGVEGLKVLEDGEEGRIERWSRVIEAIPSSWAD